MPPIHLDYLMASAVIDIFILLAISISIVTEMRCHHPSHRKMIASL
jgi:hypothetical protein